MIIVPTYGFRIKSSNPKATEIACEKINYLCCKIDILFRNKNLTVYTKMGSHGIICTHMNNETTFIITENNNKNIVKNPTDVIFTKNDFERASGILIRRAENYVDAYNKKIEIPVSIPAQKIIKQFQKDLKNGKAIITRPPATLAILFLDGKKNVFEGLINTENKNRSVTKQIEYETQYTSEGWYALLKTDVYRILMIKDSKIKKIFEPLQPKDTEKDVKEFLTEQEEKRIEGYSAIAKPDTKETQNSPKTENPSPL